jgi:transcriptional regulator with XRE-family HTH domain
MRTAEQYIGAARGLADALYICRKKKRLTQKAVGKILGISNIAIGRYEDGSTCPLAYMMPAFADVYGVDIRLLYLDLMEDLTSGKWVFPWDRRLILAYLRRHTGKGMADAAAGIGVSKQSVKQWEAGVFGPGMDVMMTALEYYGLDREAITTIMQRLVGCK